MLVSAAVSGFKKILSCAVDCESGVLLVALSALEAVVLLTDLSVVVSFVCSVVSLFGRNCVCIECCVDTANVSSNVSLTNNLFFFASLVYSLLEFSYVAVVKDGDADNLFVAVNVSLCLDFEVTIELFVVVVLNLVFSVNGVAVSVLNVLAVLILLNDIFAVLVLCSFKDVACCPVECERSLAVVDYGLLEFACGLNDEFVSELAGVCENLGGVLVNESVIVEVSLDVVYCFVSNAFVIGSAFVLNYVCSVCFVVNDVNEVVVAIFSEEDGVRCAESDFISVAALSSPRDSAVA